MAQTDKAIRVGIIGTGFMGETHAYAYNTLPAFTRGAMHVALSGVASREAERGEAFARRFGVGKAYTNWRAMVDEVDAVSVCTPNALHGEQAAYALEKGVHVYLDKPMTATLAEAQALAALAQKSGAVAQIAYNYRFFPSVMKAKQLMEAGFVGKLIDVRASFLHAALVDGSRHFAWRMDPALSGGGTLYDLGSHVLDMVQYLAEPVAAVMGETVIYHRTRRDGDAMRAVTLDDAAYALLRFASGARGMMEVTKLSTGTDESFTVEICGEKGAIRLDLLHTEALAVFDNTAEDGALGGMRGWQMIACGARYAPPAGFFPPPRSPLGWLDGHCASARSFICHIEHGEKGEPSFVDGLDVMRVMEAVYASVARGAWVDVAR